MTYCNFAKRMLRNADLFYSTEMLRYKSTSQYKTITGGVVSVFIIIAILIGFSQMILTTLDKTSITSNLETKKSKDPTKMEVVAGENKFMIGVYVSTLYDQELFDLKNGSRIFDIVATRITVAN